MYNDPSSAIFYLMLIIWFYLKEIDKDFSSITQIFKLLVWAKKPVKTYTIVTQQVITCLQSDSE